MIEFETEDGVKQVKLYGMFGSESLGKTTIGYSVTGRLRTWDILAEFVTDSSAAMPFPPTEFDRNPYAWFYVWTKKIMRECEYAIRSNVDLIISDRTPLDLFFYCHYKMKKKEELLQRAMYTFAQEWIKKYDILFWLPAEGTTFRYDKFREDTDQSRNEVEAMVKEFLLMDRTFFPNIVEAGGSYRERAEFIYHTILHRETGNNMPLNVVEVVRKYASERGWFPSQVYLEGSQSVSRFHKPSESDDYDVVMVFPLTGLDLIRMQRRVEEDREWLERMCNATLDIKVVTEEYRSNEL